MGARGIKPLYIAGIYREHRYLFQDSDKSASDRSQLCRWRKFVSSWIKAASNCDIIVIGDTNIDYVKWDMPEPAKVKLVEIMKDEVETTGFFQMVKGKTRSWPGVPDSLIDQYWMNCTARLVFLKNLDQSFSDHNLIVISVKLKDSVEDRHDSAARDRKNWDANEYNRLVGLVDWSPVLQSDNIDIANDFLETKLLEILDKMALFKNYQSRKKSSNWLDKKTKELMNKRDRQTNLARSTDSQDDWSLFKKLRNKCVKAVKSAKNYYFCTLYDKMRKENDIKGIYKITNYKDGKMYRQPCEMANLQLDFYRKKVQDIRRKIPVTVRNPHRFLDYALDKWKDKRPVFAFRMISLTETDRLILSLHNSMAYDHDGLDALAFKSACLNLLRPVQHLVNLSL